MELAAYKSEILDLLKKAQSREAAEKLQKVCKKGSYLSKAIEECLKRIQKPEEEEEYLLSAPIRSEHRLHGNQITKALFMALEKLSPEELESN